MIVTSSLPPADYPRHPPLNRRLPARSLPDRGNGVRLFLGAQHKISAFVQIVFPSKKRRSCFSWKSGRHIGIEKPYVLGCFEVKQVNRGVSRGGLRDREEMFFSVSICPGILRCKTLDLGLKKQREPASLTRFPALKQRSTGYLCSEQGTAENSRNPRSLRLLYRNKKACEIVGLHRRLKQTGGAYRT